MRMYSLLDVKLKEFGPIVLANNDFSLVRAMRDGIPGSNSTVDKHPEDFQVMYLGDFDMDTGKVSPVDIPELLDTVSTILSREV